jgi:hypothetical protein
MPITINTRKLRPVGLAIAIFTAGTGIGWHLGSLVFTGEESAPMVAAIQFEQGPLHATLPQQPGWTPELPSTAPNPDTSAALAEEARKLADAMQWAERYRRKQGERLRLAAASTHGWDEVIANAKHFGPGRYDVQRVIQAQVALENRQNAAQQVQLANAVAKVDRALASEAMAEPVVHRAKSSPEKGARNRQGRTERIARQPHERALRRPDHFFCPLMWLHAAMADLVAERRAHRHRVG